ncbi:hypothetical protein HMN09_00320700 [Mycena chlorophos]|uniref:Uncharacterized protein n=1 Tax=Mycena chlorophos TaxID=658473 RepID=A0A8H6TK24_MYCCL|nr:hypothetical protein HMN09_00320700 [Mycena chlorophos]
MYAPISAEKQAARQAALEAEVAALESKLGAGVDADAIVKKHIKLLHKYNEAKDATQVYSHRKGAQPSILPPKDAHVLQLATLKETTIRQIHEDWDLRDAD